MICLNSLDNRLSIYIRR